MKYINFCSYSASWTSTELMASSEIDKYTMMVSPCSGFCITCGVAMNCLSCTKSSSHSSLHSNFLLFLIRRIIGPVFLANLGMDLDMAVNFPTSLWISLTFFRLLISTIAWHLFGFTSISLCVSMNPRNVSPSMPNTHFSRFSLMFYLRKASSTSTRLSRCCSHESNMTTMSSTYTSTFLPISLWKTLSMSRWYVTHVFFNPNEMTSY